MTQLHPRDPENRQENWISERRFSAKTVTTGWMGKRGLISANNALFVSVDLIGEKNLVLLELVVMSSPSDFMLWLYYKGNKSGSSLWFSSFWP